MESESNAVKPLLVIVGQTPPPWHGQAVATKLLFDAEWPGFELRTIRMAFSSEMDEIGRVRFRKAFHLIKLLKDVFQVTRNRKDGILLYPPASPHWVPILRDLLLVPLMRRRFKHIVYLFHAGGVGEWCRKSKLRMTVAKLAYGRAALSLEVSKEKPSPHEVMRARSWAWSPCAVEVPPMPESRAIKSGPSEVFFVGSLQEGKGVLEIIRTAKVLKDRGLEHSFRFKLVGRWFSDAFRITATSLVEQLMVGEMIDFAGQLTGDAKWSAYHHADIFLFPSHYESEAFPLVLIEALSSGLPLVTTNWRGIPDLVEDCKVATLCPLRSPEAYADALVGWHSERHRATEIAKEARAYYERRYLPWQFLAQVRTLIARQCVPDEVPIDAPEMIGPRSCVPARQPLVIATYLADQNPKLGRSLGISRMTEVTLQALAERSDLKISGIASQFSMQAPAGISETRVLPWSTRSVPLRLLTDHLHPLFAPHRKLSDIWYFPKGFLPRLHSMCRPSVVTIHDTIIQFYADHYPEWRTEIEYRYWASMLKHTLRHADGILTISEAARGQIREFMERHGIPAKPITVTFEPCIYESIPQPVAPAKENYVLHLGSREPHKRTAWLIRQWVEASRTRNDLPKLHVVGKVPDEVVELARSCSQVERLPFLDDKALQQQFERARALIFPSEIEGFGLPAVEAYFLGTPVCFARGTSIEEVLEDASSRGGFDLNESSTLFSALDEVLALPPEQVRQWGLLLREKYAARVVADRMVEVFQEVSKHQISA